MIDWAAEISWWWLPICFFAGVFIGVGIQALASRETYEAGASHGYQMGWHHATDRAPLKPND